MRRLIPLIAALLLAAGLYWQAVRVPPHVQWVTRCATCFDERRPMADIAVIAREPHPVGTAANQRVRDHLMARLQSMGLQPRIQAARSWKQEQDGYITVANIENVIAVLPGRNPDLPALALMAHYDSVPGSPGAGDDAAGVASILEVVRAFSVQAQQGRRPIRDVVVIFTDGEEAGTLGARAFFMEDPLSRRLGFVINLDNRGSTGRTMMYETNDGPGGAMAIYTRNAPAPRSYSIFPLVYRYLPYGSDFTWVRQAGILGLNFSFMEGEADYHTASATVARLDPIAVAAQAEQANAIATRLAYGRDWPEGGARRVWADLLGWGVIAYPIGVGWLLLAAGAGLVAWAAARARRIQLISWMSAGAGAAAALYALAITGALVNVARLAAVAPGFGRLGLVTRFGAWEAVLALVVLGVPVLTIAASAGLKRWPLLAVLGLGAGAAASLFGLDLMGLGLGLTAAVSALAFRKPPDPPSAWAGAMVAALVVGMVAQVAAPEAAPVVVWPVIGAGLAAVAVSLGLETRRWLWALYAVAAAITLAWIAVLLHMSALALDFAPLIGLVAWLAVLPLWGAVSGPQSRWLIRAGAGLIGLALLITAGLRLTDPWTPATPRSVALYHVTEAATGRASLVTYGQPEAWLRQWLARQGRVEQRTFPALGAARGQAVPTAPATAPIAAPAFQAVRDVTGRVHLTVTPPLGARTLLLRFQVTAPARRIRLDGKTTDITLAPGPNNLIWRAPGGQPLDLSFESAATGRITVDYSAQNDPWPVGAVTLPTPPPDRIYAVRLGRQITTGQAVLAWGPAPAASSPP